MTPLVMTEIDKITKQVFETAKKSGFWEGSDLKNYETVATKLCLIHSEVSEALEALRNNDIDSDEYGGMVELADVVIRCFDLGAAISEAGLSKETLGEAIFRKMEKNASRAYKHGKKF